jgi:hypothetical protein
MHSIPLPVRGVHVPGLGAALILILLAGAHRDVNGAPTPGFIEKWPATTSNWSGSGAITYSNPLNAGADDDGFLMMSLASPGRFGTRSSGPEYVGDFMLAGIDQIKVKLNDLGTNNNLSIHLSIGAQANLWQYNIGFLPGLDTWTEFVVDLTDSSLFTRIVGIGSFAGALQNAELLHLRHDLAPFAQIPDNASGDLGIDDLQLVGTTVGIGDVPRAGIAPIDLAIPSPNPSRGPVALTMRASDVSPIEIRILDIQGRLVRHHQLAGAAGIRVWMWDGRDQQGRLAPAGVYRAIAASKAGGTSRSLVRVR